MYERFYKLKVKPFRLTPDPRFLYQSAGHSKALAYLRYGLQLGEGFIVITGDIGTGKTTLARAILNSIDNKSIIAAQLVTTQLDEDNILRAVASSFGLESRGVEKSNLLKHLETYMLSRFREGKRLLLFVDEAQNIPPKSLEELRMLSNFQIGEKALLQSFLLGQGEFRQTLARPDMEQFRQRIVATYHLGPISADEVREYIRHRLELVGWKNDPVITDDAYKVIHKASKGVPRKINTLCDRLFLFSCLEEAHEINEDTVNYVVSEQEMEANLNVEKTDPEFAGAQEANESLPSNVTELADVAPAKLYESRLKSIESRLDVIETSMQKDKARLQRLIMMAVMTGGDMDMDEAMSLVKDVKGMED